MRSLAATALAMMMSCSSNSGPPTTEPPKTPTKIPLSIFLTSEIKGTTEPCGCTSDPLGDIARTAAIIQQARQRGPTIVLDGGSTLYTQVQLSATTSPQEILKSNLIESALRDTIRVDAMGLGPFDFAEGVSRVRPARQAANVDAKSGIAIEKPKIIEAGGVRVGVFGLTSPTVLKDFEVPTSEAAAVAAAAIKNFRQQKSDVIVLLAHMTENEASALVKSTPGIDFVLIAQNLPEPDEVRKAPTRIHNTWLFRPANRGQVVSKLRLTYKGKGPFADAFGEARAKIEILRLQAQKTEMKKNLEKWAEDPKADAAFVATQKKEYEQLSTQISKLQRSPLQPPADGNYFTLEQIKISKDLDCAPDLVAAKKAYDVASGAANVKAGATNKPPPPPPGQAGYVGTEECVMCHKEAAAFWKTTNHAKAWETLVTVGKQFDFDCIGCHVTGFNQPGGSNIAFNEGLRDVQCEQCHGPGSLHVDAEGPARLTTIQRSPAEAACAGCHTKDHSDTFQFDAYLRDITGPGHGADFRKTLGEGPTGHKLRSEALKKAGLSIGKNCIK